MGSSVYKKNSRYVQGGTTESYANRTGWWERQQFERSDDDLLITITSVNQYRPDLLAHEIYGNAALDWLVLQYNNILDIMTEFTEGVELRLPTPARVKSDVLVKSPGGKQI